MIKSVVRLTEDERSSLMALIDKGKAAVRKIKHANVLLKIDAERLNWSDLQAAEAFHCSLRTVFTIRQRLVEFGLDAALARNPGAQPPDERLLDGEGEAHLVRLACSTPPEGQARWTLNLLVERLVELQVVETISPQTVMCTLKKRTETASSHLLGDPPEQDTEFVAGMEEVLEVYRRPDDPPRPVVCLDEQPIQLIGETRPPIPAEPGQEQRDDDEDERLGTANTFMVVEPLTGWRKANFRATKTAPMACHQFLDCVMFLVHHHQTIEEYNADTAPPCPARRPMGPPPRPLAGSSRSRWGHGTRSPPVC